MGRTLKPELVVASGTSHTATLGRSPTRTWVGVGLEGRFVGMHDFGASGKIADVYKKFDITAEAVVRAAHQTLAEVAALQDRPHDEDRDAGGR
jgi:transketolase